MYSDTELDVDELAVIGRVTIQWGRLEHLMLLTCLQLCEEQSIEPPADLFVQNLTKRLRAFHDLIQNIADGSKKKIFSKIYSKMARVQKKRHQITHGLWDWDQENLARVTASSFRPKFEFEESFDVEGLYNFGSEIGEINFMLEYPGGKSEFEEMWQRNLQESGRYISRDGLRLLSGTLPPSHPLHPMQEAAKRTD